MSVRGKMRFEFTVNDERDIRVELERRLRRFYGVVPERYEANYSADEIADMAGRVLGYQIDVTVFRPDEGERRRGKRP